jgi:hypothetical protein
VKLGCCGALASTRENCSCGVAYENRLHCSSAVGFPGVIQIDGAPHSKFFSALDIQVAGSRISETFKATVTFGSYSEQQVPCASLQVHLTFGVM